MIATSSMSYAYPVDELIPCLGAYQRVMQLLKQELYGKINRPQRIKGIIIYFL